MRKSRIVGFGLFAALALCALDVAPALAGEWLVEAANVAAALSAETEMEFELKVYEKVPPSAVVLTAIKCSGFLTGTLGPEKKDLVESLDKLAFPFEEIGELGMTNEKSLSCTVTSSGTALTDCLTASTVELWTDNLNLELSLTWETEIELTPGGEFLDHFQSTTGFEIKCTTNSGVMGENLCEGGARAQLTNEAGTVPASVLDKFLTLTATLEKELERMNSTLVGEHTCELNGTGNTWAFEGTNRLATTVS